MQSKKVPVKASPKTVDGTLDMRYKVNRERVKVVRLVDSKPVWTYKLTNVGTLTFLRGNIETSKSISLFQGSSYISCGVGQIYGVLALTRLLYEGIPQDVLRNGIRALLNYNRSSYAFSIISNHENSPINSILNELCPVKTPYKQNPNSGNKIRVWVFAG